MFTFVHFVMMGITHIAYIEGDNPDDILHALYQYIPHLYEDAPPIQHVVLIEETEQSTLIPDDVDLVIDFELRSELSI